MVTAIVLANVKRNRINETAQELLKLQGVSEVYSIAGEWDLAIMIRVKRNEDLAELITDKMLKLEGLEKTTTMIGFKAYSNHDLERMFSIGLDDA